MESVDLSILNQYPISSWAYPRILVGVPLERSISYADQVFHRFLYIAAHGPAFIETKYGRIDSQRNAMVLTLLETTFTHLLMLDLDHEHPIDIIQRLARWVLINPDVRVVSGMNFRRKAPYDPVVRRLNEKGERQVFCEWENGLIEVDELGAGSLLVDKRVFLEMDPPWFYNDYEGVWRNDMPGEDTGFSRKCKAAGIKMHVDTTTTSPHITTTTITEKTFKDYLALHPELYHEAQL